MNEHIFKVLIIGDSEADRNLLRQYLNDLKENNECHCEFFEAGLGDEAVKICRRENPDCVLLASKLTETEGLRLMSEINPDSHHPDFPVVLLTGSSSEVVAADALKKGAHDYLVKGKITAEDLQLSISKAIETARLRKERKITGERLRLFEKVMLNTRDAILITEAEPIDSPGPRIVYVNPAFTEMSGYTAEEAIGQTPRIMQGAKTDRRKLDKIRQALANWEPVRVEVTNYRKDGTEFEVEFDINPVADETGWFTHWVSVQRDVTERRRGEDKLRESEQFLQGTIDALTAHIAILDKNGVIVSVNEAWRRFAAENDFQGENFGIGQKYFDVYDPQNAEEFDRHADRAVEGLREVASGTLDSFVLEYPCDTKTENCWFIMRVTRFWTASDGVRLVVAHENITSRKTAEEKLRVSEERLSLAMKGAQIGTFDWNLKTDKIIWSREIEEATDMSTADFDSSFEGLINLIHPLDREILQNRIEEGIKTGEYECEFRMLKGDGTIRWVLGKGQVIYDENGAPLRLLGVDIDITKRKLAEEELRENQLFTESIIETAPSVLYTFNLNTLQTTYLTKQMANTLGYEFEELKKIQDRIFAVSIHPDDFQAANSHFENIKRTNTNDVFEFEYRIRHKSGAWRWFRSRDMIFKRDEHGSAEEILGVALDITERRQAEEKLRQSQIQTHLALEAGNTIAFTWDIETDRVHRMHSDFAALPATDSDTLSGVAQQIYEADREKFFANVQAALADPQKPYRSEYRIYKEDEKIAWINETGRFTLDESGKPIKLTGISADITERKRIEETLRESSERLAATYTRAPIGIVETTLDGSYINVNDEFCHITGYAKEELLNFKIKDLTHPEDFPRNFELFQKLAAGEISSFQLEKRYVRKDGSIVWAEVNRTLIRTADNEPSYVIGAIVDVTERKKTAEQLRRNHETFFNLVENTPFGTYIIDSNFKLMQISKGSRKVFSSIEAPLGRDFAEILRTLWEEPFASEVIGHFRHTLATGESYRAANTTEQRSDTEETESYDWKIERIVLPDGQYGVVCYFYDLTERLQFEEKLRESEERMRLVLNAAKIGIWIYDLTAQNIYWSPEHYEIFGTDRFDGTAEAFKKFVHPEDIKNVWRQFEESVEKGVPYKPEFRIVRQSGEICWVGNYGHIEYDADGKPAKLLGTVFDITERKHRELNLAFLADLQKQLSLLSAPEEIMQSAGKRIVEHLDLTHCLFVEISEAMDEANVIHDEKTVDAPSLLGGYKLEDFHSVMERKMHLAGRGVVINDIRRDLALDKAAANFEALGIQSLTNAPYVSDGRWKFALSAMHSQPHNWRRDELELLQSLSARIYARLESARAEIALRESEERMRLVLNAAKIGIWIYDLQNEKIEWSPEHYELFGTDNFDGTLEAFKKFVHPDDLERVMSQFDYSVKNKTLYQPEFRILRPDGEICWVGNFGHAKYDADDKPVRFLSTVFDVTERKNAEFERLKMLEREKELRREAESANRSKDEFLAVLSHELRTPLNSIAGWSQILLKNELDAKSRRQAIEIIARNVHMQNALIEDLLDVSRIISGKMRLETEKVSLLSVIESSVDAVRLAAENRRIKINLSLDPAADEIFGDKYRLQQIIGNLLNNAIKFSPENQSVIVTLNRVGNAANLTVKDEGIGISAELLPNVFDRFKQADASSKRKYGGLGLGLTIVKYLVELHGGKISAFSNGENCGSEFVVEIPLAVRINQFSGLKSEEENSSSKLESELPLTGIMILIVDDYQESLDLLSFVLEQQGAKVVCKNHASKALEEMKRRDFDLLISDLGMPEIDGYDLIREIRRIEKENGDKKIPAIALTGYVSTEDREKVTQAGFQAHLSKPVDIDNLSLTVRDLLRRLKF